MGSGVIMTVIKKLIVNIMVLIGIITMPFYYRSTKSIVADVSEDTFKSAQTTLAYDNAGNVITKLREAKDSYYISFDTIPQNIKDAFIATEDKSFYKHNGVDITGVGRAFVNLIKNGKISGGGSTITQQLVRNVFLTHEKSVERKVKEVFISVLLEKKHSKDEILEYYINSIYFANGAYGIEAASRKYFGKAATELTLGETAFLCAIPNNPTLYNPLTNYDNTVKRQTRILGYMLEDGYIKQEEYDNALAEEIIISGEKIINSNYVDTYIIDCAIECIMRIDGFEFKKTFKRKKDEDIYKAKLMEARKEAQSKLYNGGYRIYTSIDMAKQEMLQKAIDDNTSMFQDKTSDGIYAFQGSATSIDNATGKVVAIVGGRSQDTLAYMFNRAFKSYRQPGSTIKPLVLYTPLMDNGYLPCTLVVDEKIEGGPKNYDEQYEGLITLRYAVEQSKNTVAWDLFKEFGVSNGFHYLKAMNFKKIVEEDKNLAAVLGGLTYGSNTLEMASAYSTLARDGAYVKPTCIIKITDSDGNVIYEDEETKTQVYSERASRIMTNVLQSTMEYGTGQSIQLNSMVSAGKTGSTNDNKDGWFAGYTPYYTTVVWMGYDIPKSVSDLYGSTYPGRAWKQYMDSIHQGLENKGFVAYEGLQAEEEASYEQEQQKRILYELSNEISVFLSLEVNSIESIASAESTYWSLLEKINNVSDETKRNEYVSQINTKKAYIEEQKPWYYFW